MWSLETSLQQGVSSSIWPPWGQAGPEQGWRLEWELSRRHTAEPSHPQAAGLLTTAAMIVAAWMELYLLGACTGQELKGRACYHKVLTSLPAGSCYPPGE